MVLDSSGQNIPFADGSEMEHNRIIKNKIKSITTYTYNGDSALTKGVKTMYKEYDKKGNPIKEDEFTIDGNLDMQTISVNNNGKMSDTSKQYNMNGEVVYESIGFFNMKGQEIKDISYGKGHIKTINTYEFDKNGGVIRNDMFDSNSNLIYYTIYKYDEKGRMILDSGITSDIDNGKRIYYLDRKYVHCYNENKRFKVTKNYNGNNELSVIDTEKFDSNWNTTEYITYDANDGSIRGKQISEYSKDGKEVKFICDNAIIQSYYDNNGNIVEEIDYRSGIIEERKKYYYEFY
ncbi:MAG TPA: hypothetical protein VK783_16650 [Bacteroidia bacterium]|nr:hypothetical protein [Bacteroidia bacterium]